ncbi:MAG: prepilin-type N-terminal cleavage/methylation domain-containing protein [Bacteroidota bacterium]
MIKGEGKTNCHGGGQAGMDLRVGCHLVPWSLSQRSQPTPHALPFNPTGMTKEEGKNHLKLETTSIPVKQLGANPSPSKVKGNTLIEILVSLSVLSLLFIIGMYLFQQLTGIFSPVQVFQHRTIAREVLYTPIPEEYQEEEELLIKGRRIIKEITPLNKEATLLQIKVSCYWDDQLMLERNRYISLRHE